MPLQRIFLSFLSFVLTFPIQLIAGEIIFFNRLKKRNRFILRIILSLSGYFIFSSLLILFYYVRFNYSSSTVIYILVYILIFLGIFFGSLVAGIVCYKESVWIILFSGCAGYAAQNLISKLYSVIFLSTGLYAKLLAATWIFILVQSVFFGLLYPLVYYFFVKRANSYAKQNIKGRRVIIFSASTLAITAILSALSDIYTRGNLSFGIISALFSVVCCLIVLFLHSGILERSQLKKDLEIVQSLLYKEKNQMELSKESIDIINLKCHDLRHQIKTLRKQDSYISKEALKEIEGAIEIYDSSLNTGNETLDIVLTEKSLYCKKNGIQLSCMADGKKLSFIEPADLYSLFGNIIENAIEAVIKLEDPLHRVISVVIKTDKGFLFIQADNYYKGELTFENELPLTTKKDKQYHGFGMRSIKLITEKYRGYLSITCSENVFRLHIVIPFQEN